MTLVFGSVCSGIEAASVAWHPLGWRPAFFSEIDPFPRAVLQHHYSEVPLRGDFTEIQRGEHDAIDILVGGTPCQSFSVAGLRGGLGDDRGNLALEYLRLADRLRPRWLVWENVPGVLSSNGGRDFGAIIGGMVELGYGIAWRVLDAQYVRTLSFPRAVPQRRRRVFVVGHLGDWRRAAAVLFDRDSLQGHPPPRRETGQAVAPTISARPTGGGGLGTDFDLDGGLVANSGDVSYCLCSSGQQSLDAAPETLIAIDCKGSQVATDQTGSAPTLRSMNHAGSHQNGGGQLAVAFHPTQDPISSVEVSHAMGTGSRSGQSSIAVAHALRGEGFDASEDGTGPWMVRRLTPVECERLQGFPDGYTDVPWRGRPHAPDGRRYKALGNSMAVNVMQWIGERIALVEGIE